MVNNKLQYKNTSVNIAKYRLQRVLSSDRMNCSVELVDQMQYDIFHTISKYMEIEQKNFQLTLTRRDMYIKYTGE